jgi:hypothetical protein
MSLLLGYSLVLGNLKNMRIDGGVIDLQVEEVQVESVMENILTALPEKFPISTGGSIEIFEEEIIYKAESQYN